MISQSRIVAFAPTVDLVRARRFYEDVLGLTVVHSDDFACVIDANGTMLRVTAVGEYSPHSFTVLGWDVTDIEAEVDELVGKGVMFHHYEGMGQDDRRIWTAPGGGRIAWFPDVDGNTLSLTQFPD